LYEDRTFENILNEMLADVSDEVDKRQGSVIYDALAPSAAKLAQVYIDLAAEHKVRYLSTATGIYLDKKANDFGITRLLAKFAERNATFVGTTPPVGAVFIASNLYWTYQADGTVICNTAGIVGNDIIIGSKMIPLDNIVGLTSATIGTITIAGTNDETDDDFRDRIIDTINNQRSNSNIAQITEWCYEVSGVGSVRIIPLGNGPNTVKAIVTDSIGNPATQQLLDDLENYIDPPIEGQKGLGEGKADIGLAFYPIAASSLAINVTATLTLLSGHTLAEATNEFSNALVDYFKEVFKNRELIVKYSKIGALLSNCTVVEDFTNLKINSGTTNITLSIEQMPVKGTITLS
jgi:uncharacterized phage protein gp47/JayE